MPRKKGPAKRSVLPSTSTAPPSAAEPTGNRESLFSDFSSGLAQTAAATSSPSVRDCQLDEYKNTVLSQLEDEHRMTQDGIISIFDKLEKSLGKAGKTVYTSEALGENLPALEAVVKAIEDSSRIESISRKATWNSNNSENFPPPTDFRRPRRSRSVEPIPTHTTILSHRPRLSFGSGRPGMETPLTNARTFNFNIATVTPHPQFSETRNNMTVLRRPNPGEVAISMGGSPLMVNSESGSSPSVTVPLADGRVFKVLGRSSPFKEEMRRGLDAETRLKLRQLKEFIGELV